MNTKTYRNTNNDVVTIETDNGKIVAVRIFGFDVLKRLKTRELQYLYTVILGG